MKLTKSALFLVLATLPAWSYCGYSSKTGPVKTPFMVAIWQGDTKAVERFVKSGTSLNALVPLDCHDGYEQLLTTPLLQAIEARDASRFRSHSMAMLVFLLEQGADPNFRPVLDMSPLQIAAESGDIFSITVLLKHGARIDDRNDGGETALMIAAQRDNGPVMIQKLVAAGANIHLVNNLGDNAVMLAAWQHHLDTVKFLVGLGVDACAKNNGGETAIDQARSNLNDDPGKQQIISFLQEKCGS